MRCWNQLDANVGRNGKFCAERSVIKTYHRLRAQVSHVQVVVMALT